jgi:hypothetical protein
MLSPSKQQKILIAALCTLLLTILPSSCLADTHTYTYELLDSPDGDTTYRLTISVTDTLYDYYSSQDHNLYSMDFSAFATPDALKPVADDLWSIYNNQEDFANGVLMIVHQIPYVESDPQKYAAETIVENEGDCDLFSIIAASIMNAGGLDVIMLLLEQHDHMMLGVHLPEKPEDARTDVCSYEYEGKTYYVAETTGGKWETGWRVGECHESLQRTTAKIIPLENCEKQAPGQVSSSYIIPVSGSIHMALSTNFAVLQNNVEIRGTLSPSLAGENVTLYVSSFGSSLTKLATVVTDNNGQYNYMWRSPPGGVHSVRANWSGDEEYSGADSSIFRVVVVPFEYLMVGVTLTVFLFILIIVTLATRGASSENLKALKKELELADYPQDF